MTTFTYCVCTVYVQGTDAFECLSTYSTYYYVGYARVHNM